MLTYNREKLVGRAVESILAQTYRDFEFIIVDNGSTDNSAVIADEYAKKDSRIRVMGDIPFRNCRFQKNRPQSRSSVIRTAFQSGERGAVDTQLEMTI